MASKRKCSPDRSNYYQRYKTEWESEFKWIKRGSNDTTVVCKLCNSDLSVGKGGKKDLLKHAGTQSHKKNERAVSGSSLSMFVVRQDNSVVDAELRWANFVAENHLPMALSDNFNKLVPAMFPDSAIAKEFRCARTKTSQLIHQALGDTLRENIVDKMKSTFFTLMIDESTDVSVIRQMVIMARVFNEDEVKTDLYKIVELVGAATGENLFNAVRDAFLEDAIPWENCLAMSSDGARAMVGEFNSVLSRVRSQQSDIWFLHCTCHVAHLAASHACEQLPEVCEQLARDTYTYFKTSGKRQDEFKVIQESVDVEMHKILRPSFTRWLALLQCINRLVEQWPALTEYFDTKVSPKEENSEPVKRIKYTLHSPTSILYFLFLQAVLPRFTKFNVMFQHSRPYIHKLKKEMHALLRRFLASFVQFSVIQKNPITEIDFTKMNQLPDASLFIGHETQSHLESINISNEDKNMFFEHVRMFYVKGASELYRLLPLSDEVLECIKFLDPSERQEGNWDQVVTLVKRFPSIIKPECMDLLNEEFMSYALCELPSSVSASEDEVDTYWANLSKLHDNGCPRFPTLCKLAKALLILPHSNADVERLFSKLALVKTAHRSCLSTESKSRKDNGEFTPSDVMRNRAKHLKKKA